MPRNNPTEAVRRKKCRSLVPAQESSQGNHSGKPVSRRQLAYTAALHAELVAEYATTDGWTR